MAHLLRGKQAGVNTDLSHGLGPDLLVLDHMRNYGINSKITQVTYDPVQSLLAVGTAESPFGAGQIYVFGQKRVEVVLPLSHRASVKMLQFCGEKLLCVDSRNDLSVFSLATKALVNAHSPPAKITALHCDPTLDYALLGTQQGDVFAYDLDRQALTPFRIANLWREQFPRSRLTPVVTLSLHPRDIGSLLIGYSAGAVIYSFKQNKALRCFHYRLPKGAPGGDSDPASVHCDREPPLTQAVWHPTGTFILTGHEDSSIVVWDPKDGRIIQARTLQDVNVNLPGPGTFSPGAGEGTFALKSPIFKIAWCANQDPDETGILIAGGQPSNISAKSLTFFELGRTPIYNTSSWQVLSNHFENPTRQRILPCPPGAEVVDLCLIPRSSPHFGGCQDPIAIIAILASGELVTLSFPSGMPITPTNQLHLSMTLVHPYIGYANLAPVDRTRWLGMTEKRQHGPKLLTGGAGANWPLKRFEHRNIVQTAHADGTVRLWDAGHADEIENDGLLQIDVARAVGCQDGVEVTTTSFAGAASELSVGLKSGEVVIFRWNVNKHPGEEFPPGENKPQALTNIVDRSEAALKEGLLPFTLLDEGNGPVTALKHSDVGFVAAGFEGGGLVIIDLRGPAVIYRGSTQDFKSEKRGSFRRSKEAAPKPEWPTCLEFSVMTLENEDFSSILLHAGTNLGHVATFKLVPESNGRYGASFAGVSSLDDRVISLCPMHAESGRPAYASQSAVAGLRNGSRINGVLLAVTVSGARLFRPASHKGAHKTWDQFLCDSAAVVRYEDLGYALLGLYGDGCARAFSLPALKEIGAVKVAPVLDVRRFADAVITSTGDVLGWTGPAEMALVNVFGTGVRPDNSRDTLLNPDLTVPPRPTISNLQWISGTQYVTPADMDLLIGGPDRPPSARMLAQTRADEDHARRAARAAAPSSSAANPSAYPSYPTPAAAGNEGWGAWASRQFAERTEKLNQVGDSMDSLSSNSAGWAEDVNKYVNKQKRGLVTGMVKSKFGL
ncbi:lethal giant larvae like, C-terminal-domain-containing protein [Boeremia exigua]|uniref:lethal giant larvae like, C-terminal-domain-containing protein n=1 Tax=Boeremia exigua TaxID=749465 RepID=UPI001E8D955A|nr:lethal giant larvae like, C-terminal-domain-containing protein [Boeremia exigua]KAH6637433.1 lethal giant larvae like, C-terminal-domain-containing protein [Boeremia exigua]